MIGEENYTSAVSQDSVFYSDSAAYSLASEEPWTAEKDIPPTWVIIKRVPWTYARPFTERMRTVGWKIHLGGNL